MESNKLIIAVWFFRFLASGLKHLARLLNPADDVWNPPNETTDLPPEDRLND